MRGGHSWCGAEILRGLFWVALLITLTLAVVWNKWASELYDIPLLDMILNVLGYFWCLKVLTTTIGHGGCWTPRLVMLWEEASGSVVLNHFSNAISAHLSQVEVLSVCVCVCVWISSGFFRDKWNIDSQVTDHHMQFRGRRNRRIKRKS
jgi:DMSO reductase anchor subunit